MPDIILLRELVVVLGVDWPVWAAYPNEENLAALRVACTFNRYYAFEYFERVESDEPEDDCYDDGDAGYGHTYW